MTLAAASVAALAVTLLASGCTKTGSSATATMLDSAFRRGARPSSMVEQVSLAAGSSGSLPEFAATAWATPLAGLCTAATADR
jgi:hypothetical protein